MRIAHLSDPHLLSFDGVTPRRFLNKRLSGWANLKMRRKAIHRPEAVHALIAHVAGDRPDHVVVTGDLTNLALESEFELCREVFAGLGLPPDRVSIIPGNHDAYTRGAHRARRFESYFGEHLTSDVVAGHGFFPFVRLRDDVAIVGLSSAVPRLPFVASGAIGTEQLEALQRVLDKPEVRDRFLVVLVHHPPLNSSSSVERALGGLTDAEALVDVLSAHPQTMVLHGHLHRRLHRRHRGLDVVGATSASLVSGGRHRRSGVNVYDVGRDRAPTLHARVWLPGADALETGEVPLV